MSNRYSNQSKHTPKLCHAARRQAAVYLPMCTERMRSSPRFGNEFRLPAITAKPDIGQRLVRDGFSSGIGNDVVGGRLNIATLNRAISQAGNDLETAFKLPHRDSEDDYVVIPPLGRAWDLSAIPLSTRLQNISASYGCRRLGDLPGLHCSRILRWRNLGITTVRTLMAFAKSVQQGDLGFGSEPDLSAWPTDQKMQPGV